MLVFRYFSLEMTKNSTKWARVEYKHLEETNKSKKISKLSKFISKSSASKNFKRYLPWDKTLKNIESKYGSGFLSLFEFTRWLFIFNLVICLLTVVFIVAPQFAYENDSYEPIINDTYIDCNTNDTIRECCPLYYEKQLNNAINSTTATQILLDVFKGTGYMQKYFFFYGSYSNGTLTDKEHIYNMGLSFFLTTIISLLISALTMIMRISNSFKKSIIDKIDSEGSIRFCNRVFCTWDYKLKAKTKKEIFFINYARVTYFRFFQSSLNDLKYLKKMAQLTSLQKTFLLIRRIFVNIFTVVIFVGGFFGFYIASNEAFKEKQRLTRNNEKDVLVFALEYVPAVLLKVLNIVFRLIFTKVEFIEDYKLSTRFTILLFRTGFARIGSILFLLITMSQRIINNPNICEKQIVEFNTTLFAIDTNSIWCWESYAGSELYKLTIIDFLLVLAWPFVELIGKSLSKCSSKLSFLHQPFDLESKFLDLLTVQMIFWLAIYFSPFLSAFAPIFYFVHFYIDLLSLKYLTRLDEKNQINSKLNTPFFIILFVVYLLVLMIIGLVFTITTPSSSCGPFMLHDNVLESCNEFIGNTAPFVFDVIDVIFSNLFLFAVCVVLLSFIWIFLTYSKTYSKISDELRKLIKEEHSKNDRLSHKLKKLTKSLETADRAPAVRTF